MVNKTKFFLKWVFVFSILSIWTIGVVYSLGTVSGEIFRDPVNIPIYKETSSGIEKMSSQEIMNFLFKRNFEIEKKFESVPQSYCSIRAIGEVSSNQESFGNGELNFNVNYLINGQGSLTAQKNRKRLVTNFEPMEVLKSDNEDLNLKLSGNGRINFDIIDMNNSALYLDKENLKVTLISNSISATDMDVTFIEGCLNFGQTIFIVKDLGELPKDRSISEVRDLLNNHPEFADAYSVLKRLFTDYWWLIVPSTPLGVS